MQHDVEDGPAPRPEQAWRAGWPLSPGQLVRVRGLAPDGAPRWAFEAEFLSDDGDALALRVYEGGRVDGPEPWSWPADGRLALWRSRYYSVLSTHRAGRFPYWYCAIHTPVEYVGGELRVVDLGLDVQLFADGRYSVGGEAPTADGATDPLAGAASAAVEEVVALMKRKAPPFDGVGQM